MAYVEINKIEAWNHLKNCIEYITDDEKTKDKSLVDSYQCGFFYDAVEAAFKNTISKTRIEKGNNIAWHLVQSFSPEDNVTPEQAQEIGKELVRKMYPDRQYVIATHIDKGHIHNHIVMCSVDLVQHKKLVSNITTLNKARKISDEICQENGLSVIDKNSKSHKMRLKKDIDEVIENSDSYLDFIQQMQQKGWTIKSDKYLSFKDENMKKYIRSTSISLDYDEGAIKNRIETKRPIGRQNRKIYDDKIKYRSHKKKISVNIDEVIKKVNTYDEFLDEMKKRNFEVKPGKHLAFRYIEPDKSENSDKKFTRCDTIGYKYSEEVLRYRIENREKYAQMEKDKIDKVFTKEEELKFKRKGEGLYIWAFRENDKRMAKTHKWMEKEVLVPVLGKNFKYSRDLHYENGLFFEKYDDIKSRYRLYNIQLKSIEEQMRNLVKAIKSIETYWNLKPIIQGYNNIDINNLSDDELKAYKSNMGKWHYNNSVIDKVKEQYGTLSLNELRLKFNELKNQRAEIQTELIEQNLTVQNYENAKFNIMQEHAGVLEEDDFRERCEEAVEKVRAKQKQKENIKSAISNFIWGNNDR